MEHQRYNEMLCEARGYDLEVIEAPLRERDEWGRATFTPRRQLAGTVALEHLTAIMADDLLSHDDIMKNANPALAELWRWHAIEETEHKSVAFDVYMAVGGNTRERRIALIMNTWFFFKDVFPIVWRMLKWDGKHRSPRVWLSGLNFLFGKPGFLRRITFSYLKFFSKRFHPWQRDNRHLIDAWVPPGA